MENEEGILMAYLAGAMDGDGTFCIGKSIRRDQLNHYPILQLGNLNKDLIGLLHQSLGGNIAVRKAHISNSGKNRREFYVWRASHSKSLYPIEKLLPYLIGKKDRAEFLKEYILNNPSQSGGKKLSIELVAEREKSYYKMRDLNNFDCSRQKVTKKQCTKNSESPIFWSYLAGLFDTDGSFTIGCRENRYFRAQAQLHMKDLRCFNYINENFIGANFGVKKDKTSKNGILYRLEVRKIDVLKEFLERIHPYIRQKKAQVELLLKFLKDKKTYTHTKPGMPEEELAFRLGCKQQMMELNKL
jgi:hypothetical protein